jgi:hypothetical protein
MSPNRRRLSAELFERSESVESSAADEVIDTLAWSSARKALVKYFRRAFARLLRWAARRIEPRDPSNEIKG